MYQATHPLVSWDCHAWFEAPLPIDCALARVGRFIHLLNDYAKGSLYDKDDKNGQTDKDDVTLRDQDDKVDEKGYRLYPINKRKAKRSFAFKKKELDDTLKR